MEQQELAPSVSASSFLRIALDALNAKALRWAVLLLSAAAFGYVMYQPHWIRLVAACVFTVAFVIPGWWKGGR